MKLYNLSFFVDEKCNLLDYIKKGIKTVEGRKYAPGYQNIQTDDVIIFTTNKGEKLAVSVTYVNKYKTLEEYIKTETVEKTVPHVKTDEEALTLYNSFSSLEEREQLVEKYGYSFLGIGIKVINVEDLPKYEKHVSIHNKLKKLLA